MKDALVRAHICLAATILPPLIRILPFRWVLAMMNWPARWTPYRGVDADRVLQIVQRRLTRPRLMRRRACLRRGLLLYHYLRLAGYRPALHFGLRSHDDAGDRLRGHCWVELDGCVLGEEPPGLAVVLSTK